MSSRDWLSHSLFQSTHPHGVRLLPFPWDKPTQRFQSTHPHGVRHTTPWKMRLPRTFQSTHPHGVRQPRRRFITKGKPFQSTHPHGVRHACLDRAKVAYVVSIHAPTRGATCKLLPLFSRIDGFNPRTHTGCDVGCHRFDFVVITFQSTHPHGVRHGLPSRPL